MSSNQRGMAFIDFDNIAIPAKNFYGIQYIDFNKFRNILLSDCRGVGCTVYLPYTMRRLLYIIQKSGLNVTVVSPSKSVDGRLIFDLLVNAHRDTFDIAIIASGDRDYRPVIEEVKSLGKVVKVASFSRNLAHAIESVADSVINLDSEVANLSSRVFTYTCPKCSKDFTSPRPIYKKTPLCPTCFHS